MTVDEREEFILVRHSRCEVCGMSREQSRELFKKDLCIDHCHITNVNKGVLCVLCNAAAGSLQDNTTLSLSLYKYLERTRTDTN